MKLFVPFKTGIKTWKTKQNETRTAGSSAAADAAALLPVPLRPIQPGPATGPATGLASPVGLGDSPQSRWGLEIIVREPNEKCVRLIWKSSDRSPFSSP